MRALSATTTGSMSRPCRTITSWTGPVDLAGHRGDRVLQLGGAVGGQHHGDRPGPGLDGLAEDLEDLVHTVGEQVLVEDLAHGQVALAGAELGAVDQVQDLVVGLQLVAGDRDQRAEGLLDGPRPARDDRGRAGRQLEDPAGAHGRGVEDRVHVEEDLVHLVRGQHLVVGELAHDVRDVLGGPGVLLVHGAVAGEDVQAELADRGEDGLHLLAAFGVLVPEVHAREDHVVQAPVLLLDRVVHPGLGRELQDVDPVVSQHLAVAGHHVAVAREDVVEQLGRVDEELEVRRVLLVPEDRGDPLGAAPVDQGAQLRLGGVVPGHLVAPAALVAVPGRLHEQQLGPASRRRSPASRGARTRSGPTRT